MRVLAAGSLRAVWPSLMAHFPQPVETCFGPAGLLRERIERGEPCDLFASANLAHPQALLSAGLARSVAAFTSNRLCLTVRTAALRENEDWLSLLAREDLRVATSAPGADPCGDYARALFSALGDAGAAIGARSMALVGGRHSAPVPAGTLAAAWLIQGGQADLFIGYASYAPALRQIAGLTVMPIPAPFNPSAQYACAVMTAQGQRLATFLQSEVAQACLHEAGFAG